MLFEPEGAPAYGVSGVWPAPALGAVMDRIDDAVSVISAKMDFLVGLPLRCSGFDFGTRARFGEEPRAMGRTFHPMGADGVKGPTSFKS